MGRRHGVADVSPQKRLKGASPGGGGCGRAPCSGFLRLPRPVGTDGRRAYAMPPFLRGTPAVGPGGRNLPAVRAGQKGMAAGMGTDRAVLQGKSAPGELPRRAFVFRTGPAAAPRVPRGACGLCRAVAHGPACPGLPDGRGAASGPPRYQSPASLQGPSTKGFLLP